MGQDGPNTNIWHQITFETHIQVILDPNKIFARTYINSDILTILANFKESFYLILESWSTYLVTQWVYNDLNMGLKGTLVIDVSIGSILAPTTRKKPIQPQKFIV